MTKVTRLTVDDGGNIKSRRIHLREISGDSDTPLETVGQDLRAARLRRGDDLATVSKSLKIRKDHLEAIEEDRLDALPGRTYAVGFVRSYADYLGLDVGQVIERFKAEIAGRDTETQQPVTVIDEDDNRRLPQGWKIIAGVVLLLMAYGAYYVLTSSNTMMSQPVAPPPQQLAPKPVAVQTPPPAVLTPPPQTTVAPPAATATPDATAAPGTTPAPGTAPAAPPATEAPLPPGQVYGSANHGARVVLRVHQPARVLVQGEDGMVYINRTLQPGDTYQVPNVVGLTLTTTNAKAVELDLDGQAMGYAGRDSGMAEALSLDPQSIVDRSSGGPG